MFLQMNETDLDLLSRYTRHHAEDAFAEIVRRHLDLVYSAALRQVRSPQLAEEVAQSAFTDLARNAHRLAPDTILTAWLYQVTRRTAIDVVRREARRQLREQMATEMNALNATAAGWTHIEPILDEAMSALDETDRAAVLLRYFENKSLREIGQTLGTSDDAAQKRVRRAVERLREFFAKHGITVGAGGLAVAITANAVQAAPIGMALTISTAAVLAGTTIATTATATATKAIAMTTIQKTIVGATLATALGTGIYEAHQASRLRVENQTLRQQQAPLTEQTQQLQRERDATTRQLAALRDDNERLNRNTPELLRLRAEVTRLRSLQKESATQREVSSSELPEWKPDQLMNAGRSTPQNAAQTFFWASATTNLTEMANCVVPDASDPPSDEAIESFIKKDINYRTTDFLKVKVLSQTNVSTDEVQLELYAQSASGVGVSRAHTLRNVEGQWKLVLFNTRDADGKILYVGLGKKHSPP